MSWSPQQDAALKRVREWLADKNGPQIFRLFGYAGSGKTTLAKEVAAQVSGKVLFACFTGKAALVLRQKGCDDASTIHSLIYKPTRDEITGEMHFNLNRDSALASAGLLIIDEVSMVGEELAREPSPNCWIRVQPRETTHADADEASDTDHHTPEAQEEKIMSNQTTMERMASLATQARTMADQLRSLAGSIEDTALEAEAEVQRAKDELVKFEQLKSLLASLK